MSGSLNHTIFDFVIMGAGILGISTAWQLHKQYPDKTILIVEKESTVAAHQTGHNSGVIHAGVYYKPGSLKARFCKAGNIATKAFCSEHNIPFDECGKLLVATNAVELERMQALIQRCSDNDLEIEVLDQQQLNEREPNISGVGAIFVPSTGIVSFARITEKMAKLVEQAGAKIQFNTRVEGLEEFDDRITLYTDKGRFHGRYLVSCAGLQSDRVVKMLDLEPEFQIIPFRGEYFQLSKTHNQIVNHLIYPIPDPELPFLGVHLTRMIDGSVTVGPNAVLAFKREGYRKRDICFKDSIEMLGYPGMIKLLLRHFKASLAEFKNSISKSSYLKLVQKYCPTLRVEDMQPYPAGIRAQAVFANGELVDDFLFMSTKRALVVCNAPSPAATSAIPIGEHIVEKLGEIIGD